MVTVATFSLPVGAALATGLFDTGGAWGVSSLRLGLASIMLLLLARPMPWRWGKAAWRDVVLFGISLAGMNGFFYAANDRIPLGVTVTILFVGPLAFAELHTMTTPDTYCNWHACALLSTSRW